MPARSADAFLRYSRKTLGGLHSPSPPRGLQLVSARVGPIQCRRRAARIMLRCGEREILPPPPPLFSFKKPSLVSEGGSARSDVVTFRGLGRPASTAGDDVATIPDSDVESLASASSALAPASHRTRTTSASSSGSGSGAGAPAHSRQSGGRRPSGAENGDGLSATPRAARRRQQRRQATSAGRRAAGPPARPVAPGDGAGRRGAAGGGRAGGRRAGGTTARRLRHGPRRRQYGPFRHPNGRNGRGH